MPKIELYKLDNSVDPPASFATDAEIEIANRLRHQLEERYLAPSAQHASHYMRSSKGH